MMDTAALQTYLHQQIPLSAAMQVTVHAANPQAVTLAAPLAPNINHKHTVFGGSASALAILSAWSVIHLRLLAEGLPGEIVIQSNEIAYDKPIRGTFEATGTLADAAWPIFRKTLERRGLARIEASARLTCDGEPVGSLTGRFVAFLRTAE
ncbi:YiiD C-terminal domain-containing protein [Stakelama tenebrarum]|uniref:Thioesterase n=1 Tax=Stakelama tenebrarum TaxID=2711215 RepID=A0A6G6Y6F6_9SPHN|nr:YiiD C-terminal domain-containing protein [Sphingosinithalassobacter tenebrarum]QIG80431.1 thioesterase [Sphingosinithalassobacter tenebrarum]